MWFRPSLKARRTTQNRAHRSSRRPVLEWLEDRLVPSAAQSPSLLPSLANTKLTGIVMTTRANTSTTLLSSANPSVLGQPVTFTATIYIRGLGVGNPTGTVQFQIDGSNAGNPVSVSTAHGLTTASLSTASLAVGPHTVTASYSGDTNFVGSSGTLTGGQTVNPAVTNMALAASANPSVSGQAVTFTATISVLSPGAGTPTGTVQFQIDGNNAGNPVSVSTTGGLTTASFSSAGLAVGTHTVTASYSGDGSFSGSSAPLAGGQVVNLAATSTAVSTSVNAAVFGQSVTFTATISVLAPGAGTPTGTVQFQIDGNNVGSPVSVTISGGLATASMSTTTLTVGSHLITANYSGDGSFTASSGTLTGGQGVNQAATMTLVGSSVNASVFGQGVAFTATISVLTPGAGTPTGTVQFQIDGSNVGSPISVTTSGGLTTASFSSASLAVGTHTITARYSGDGSFSGSSAPLAGGQVVNLAATSTAVSSSVNSAVFGQSVTFTATVSVPAPGAGTPTGTVQFQIDGSNAGSPVNVTTSGGLTTASFSTTALTVGSHTVTAIYSGNGGFATSTGNLIGGQPVGKAGTNTVVTTSIQPSVSGQAATFTATISIPAPGAGTPAGTVQFQIDGSNAGNPVNVAASSGTITAVFSIATLPVGTHTITANYSGDGNFTASTGSLSGGQTVNKASTSTGVTSSVNPSVFGQSVTFLATISVLAPGAGTPTGTVQFQIDGSNAGSPVSVTTSGGLTTASFSTSGLTVGSHTVTASYSGDGSFATSNGTLSGGQLTNRASTSTAVAASVNPSVFGQSVTFTAMISITAPGAGTPTGTVQFQIDGSNAGNPVSVNTSGGVATASFSTTTLTVATHTITASYSGDGSFVASSGSFGNGETVNKAGTSTVVAASANPSVFGQSVTFTATVTASAPGSGIPSGTVQFQIDGNNFGNPVTLSSGQATSPATSALSVSSHTIKVVYSGDTNFAPSNGTLTETVNQAATKVNSTSSVNASVFGQAATFTATISVQNPGAGTPGGTVQFQMDGSNAGSPVNVSTVGGVTTASFSTALAVGTHTIKANYNGDASFGGSSGSITQTVNKASTSTAVASSLNPSFFGQTVTFTATISVVAPGAGTPTGTVQFRVDGSNLGNPVTVSTAGGVTTASLSTSTLTVATHTITASYGGDGNFLASDGTLSGGQVVKPSGVSADQSSSPGILTITSDPGNNAITIKQVSPGVLRVYGDPVSPPAMPTHVNGTDHADFTLASLTGISIQFANGNDKVTLTGFSLSGDVTISAGSGSDTFTLDTLTANGISISGTGADVVGVTTVMAKKDLNIVVGPGSSAVTVKNTTCLDLLIHAHSAAHDQLTFDLENDTVTDVNAGGLILDDSHGAGDDTVLLSYVNIAYQLYVTLGSGENTVNADHVTATFGSIDGGEPDSGENAFFDNGGNSGFYVYHFIGH